MTSTISEVILIKNFILKLCACCIQHHILEKTDCIVIAAQCQYSI